MTWTPEEFRKEQLVRLRLLQEYTRRMRHNADILQPEWGEYGFNRRRYADEDAPLTRWAQEFRPLRGGSLLRYRHGAQNKVPAFFCGKHLFHLAQHVRRIFERCIHAA